MTRFTALDAVVLVVYLAGTTALGLYVGRRQRDAKDYFVADRAIPWWAVMFSIVASETSALTFISTPGLSYGNAPGFGDLGFLQIVAGYIIGRVVVAAVLLPRYFEGNLVTAYALLETRFGIATRRFTSIVFMVTRALADSVRVFATAIPVALIISPSVSNKAYVMPIAVLMLGLLTVLYTYKGGMKAVVWTELVQAGIYLSGGAAAVLILGHLVPGGWSEIWSSAAAAGKTRAVDFYPGLDRPHTIWAGLVGGAFLAMASHGTDQLIVQRLMSSRSLRDAQRAIIGSGFVVFAQFFLFLLIGLGLWAFYQGRLFPATDQIFPTFILEHMPTGLVGLIVAAIVAATMSTHSGAINSLAGATTHDIYLPLTKRAPDDAHTLKMGRLFALGWGIVLTLGALLFPQDTKTPVVIVALGIASFTYGGLLGGFFLGIFWRRAIERDAILGMSVAIAVMAFIVFAKPLVAAYPSLAPALGPFGSIAWPWYVLIGTAITLLVGILSSLTHPSPARPAAS
ncbi:MAG TPA: sodium:solute symporter [Gemmatimonadaceae bacterium]|jgi:SSS family transporter|nr:sodium:solute symporter [Gemmatimonadaceae bacterium]